MLKRFLTFLSLLAPVAASSQSHVVDLELVIAVDGSRSIDAEEFALQAGGIAAAFADPLFHEVVAQTAAGGIAVTYVQWSGRDHQRQVVGWRHVTGAASAVGFAKEVLQTGRVIADGPTSIGGAIEFSTGLLESNAFEGKRRVIDISGDGFNNTGNRPEIERDAALERGVIINGLTILNESPKLDAYFRRRVIGGRFSFVIAAQDFEGYREAFLRKLIREVRGQILAQAPLSGE